MNNQGSPIPSYGVSLNTTQVVDDINLTTAVQEVPQIQTTVTENGPEITTIINAPFIQVTSVNGQTGDVTIDAKVEQFKTNKQYSEGSLCVNSGSLYIAKRTFTSGTSFNPNDWIQVQGGGGGGGVSVQSDWNASNPSDPAYIKNKPTRLSQIDNTYTEFTQGEKNKLAQTQIFTQQEKTKLSSTEIFTQNDKNKLSQTEIYTQADKSKLNSTLVYTQSEKTKLANLQSITSEDKAKLALLQEAYTTAEKNKLAGIEVGAQRNIPQVQSDWTQSNSAHASFIKNKPNNIVQDAHYVHTDNNFTNEMKDRVLENYIQNKPQSVKSENIDFTGIPSYKYKDTEIDTGKKWIDGRSIFRKVVRGTVNMAGGYNTSNIPHGITDLTDAWEIISWSGNMRLSGVLSNNPIKQALPYIEGVHQAGITSIDKTNITVSGSYNWGRSEVSITMEYVK